MRSAFQSLDDSLIVQAILYSTIRPHFNGKVGETCLVFLLVKATLVKMQALKSRVLINYASGQKSQTDLVDLRWNSYLQNGR